jgi:phosphoribosyl-ATP pyrophosphohydrolase
MDEAMTDHILNRIHAVIESRRAAAPENSYVARLLSDDVARCAQKFGEEAVETVIEAMRLSAGEDARARFTEEAADAVFHLMVLCARLDIPPDEIWDVLARRFGKTGLRPDQ